MSGIIAFFWGGGTSENDQTLKMFEQVSTDDFIRITSFFPIFCQRGVSFWESPPKNIDFVGTYGFDQKEKMINQIFTVDYKL